MADWPAFAQHIHEDDFTDVRSEGEGWLTWLHIPSQCHHIAVRSDNGALVKRFAVQSENSVSDMLAAAKWTSSLSEMERDRALAAVESLENG